jgi:hypothetical protein
LPTLRLDEVGDYVDALRRPVDEGDVPPVAVDQPSHLGAGVMDFSVLPVPPLAPALLDSLPNGREEGTTRPRVKVVELRKYWKVFPESGDVHASKCECPAYLSLGRGKNSLLVEALYEFSDAFAELPARL